MNRSPKRRDPKPRPEHVRMVENVLRAHCDGDWSHLVAPLAKTVAILARDWRDERKRVRYFAAARCCPFCGWNQSACQCKRPT